MHYTAMPYSVKIAPAEQEDLTTIGYESDVFFYVIFRAKVIVKRHNSLFPLLLSLAV
jgi:hypothetical protein